MALYEIAGLRVNMPDIKGRTLKQAEPYLSKNQYDKADFTVEVSEASIKSAVKAHPELSEDDWEYMLTGSDFYKKLISYNGILLHASCISLDGEAYAFSGISGAGKSTHTKLWLDYFGNRAHMINDDKPAIRIIDGKIFACGTPWSGTEDYSTPENVLLHAVCFIKQGNENKIKKADIKSAVFNIYSQTVRRLGETDIDKLFNIIEEIFNKTPIYELECDISESAMLTAYNEMKK